MGWTNGGTLAENVWKQVCDYIPEKEWNRVANAIIELFENEDCDTMEEAETLSKAACRSYGILDEYLILEDR